LNIRIEEKNALRQFYEDLVEREWYWEDTSSAVTSTILKKEAAKNKKKNFFLIRDGSENNPDKYTLEVCLGVTEFVQKISLKDISACLNYSKQLKSSGYTICAKRGCDVVKVAITKESLSKQTSEDKKLKRDKKRREERDKKKNKDI